MEQQRNQVTQILNEVRKVIRGKDPVLEMALVSIMAGGHILIEDIPGVGKTSLAMAFSKAMELEEHRMQFTPDVLASDVVGFNIMGSDGQFEYKPGVVLCNLFLADEINRTSSKTQSALLEVMEERQVTVDGITRKLPKPFIVIATQNPVGSVGTQMLPDSQLDRFMIRITMGYPSKVQEVRMLRDRQLQNPIHTVMEKITREELLTMQSEAKSVFIDDKILEYIASLVDMTRRHPLIQLGMSPRGTLALSEMAKARAYMYNRDYVLPEDVNTVLPYVAIHRILLSPKARVTHVAIEEILKEIIMKTPAPQVSQNRGA